MGSMRTAFAQENAERGRRGEHVKRTLLVFIFIILAWPLAAWADTPPSLSDLTQIMMSGHEEFTQDVERAVANAQARSQFEQDLAQQEENSTYMERLAAGLVVGLPNFLIKVARLQDPVALIFQEEPQSDQVQQFTFDNAAYTPPGDLYLWTFRENEFHAVAVMYETVKAYLPIILVLAIIFVGAMLYLAAWNDRRASLKEYLLGLIIGLVALWLGVYFWQVVFDLNRSLVLLFRSTFTSAGTFFDILWQPNTKSLGMAIVAFLVAFSVGALNWQYIMRKITLGVLIFIFPIVAAFSVFPAKRRALDVWMREFLANVFLQAAHAGAYAFFIVFAGNTTSNPDWLWYTIVFIMGINGIAGLIRRLIGAETLGGGGAAIAGAAVGLGSFAALARMGGLMYAGQKAMTPAGLQAPGGGAGGFTGGGSGGSSPGSGLPGGAAAGVAPGIGSGGIKSIGLRGGGIMAAGAARALNATAVGLGSLAGGMISGVLTGNEAMGVAGGAAIGSIVTNPVERGLNAAGRAMRSVADEHAVSEEGILSIVKERAGIQDTLQLYDMESAAGIGSHLLGTPGAVIGGAASLFAQGMHKVTGLGDEPAVRAAHFKGYREEHRTEWAKAHNAFEQAVPQLQRAKEELAHAKAQYGEQSAQFAAALDAYNDASAEASWQKSKQLEEESYLSHQGVKKKFAKLREDQAAGRLRGGVFDMDYGWREDDGGNE